MLLGMDVLMGFNISRMLHKLGCFSGWHGKLTILVMNECVSIFLLLKKSVEQKMLYYPISASNSLLHCFCSFCRKTCLESLSPTSLPPSSPKSTPISLSLSRFHQHSSYHRPHDLLCSLRGSTSYLTRQWHLTPLITSTPSKHFLP